MIDFPFMYEALMRLLPGIPMTLQLAFIASVFGVFFALAAALMQLSGNVVLRSMADFYVFCIRGTPLLIQLFLIYYGIGGEYRCLWQPDCARGPVIGATRAN